MYVEKDRLTFILNLIDEWEKTDPNLEDKQGFIEFLKTQEIGLHRVGDIKIWLRYYDEARKKRVTVPELLFDKARESKRLNVTKEGEKPRKKIPIDVVSEEELKELKEISSRLRSLDRLRKKE